MFWLGAKIFGHVSHSTELVCMCLACQHLDFNSADWISGNLHVISSRYLRTMGKEFIFQFSRRSWGRNAWRNPKNVCVGGYKGNRCVAWILRALPVWPSLPSLTLRQFQPRSRPFVWLLARTWIRKNTDCFAVCFLFCLFVASRLLLF